MSQARTADIEPACLLLTVWLLMHMAVMGDGCPRNWRMYSHELRSHMMHVWSCGRVCPLKQKTTNGRQSSPYIRARDNDAVCSAGSEARNRGGVPVHGTQQLMLHAARLQRSVRIRPPPKRPYIHHLSPSGINSSRTAHMLSRKMRAYPVSLTSRDHSVLVGHGGAQDRPQVSILYQVRHLRGATRSFMLLTRTRFHTTQDQGVPLRAPSA